MDSNTASATLAQRPALREYIVYACPSGELAQQLQGYFDLARATCGPNTAHRYMPHITLTGFFHDQPGSVSRYVSALDAALHAVAATNGHPHPRIHIEAMRFQPEFHFLHIDSPWLIDLTAQFAQGVDSPTRRDALRLKDWLHLSLAYGFQAQHTAPLIQLACAQVDISAPVGWELRFYERLPNDQWVQHAAWPLEQPVEHSG